MTRRGMFLPPASSDYPKISMQVVELEKNASGALKKLSQSKVEGLAEIGTMPLTLRTIPESKI